MLCGLLKEKQRGADNFLSRRTDNDEYEIPVTALADNLDAVDILAADPGRLMSCLAQAAGQALRIDCPLPGDYRPTIRLTDYPRTNKIRGLGGDHMGKMVGIRGMVSHVAAPTEVPLVAPYVCPDGHTTTVYDGSAPAVCSNPDCKRRKLTLLESKAKWGRAQEIILQEIPQDMERGDSPAYISCVVDGSLVEYVQPGRNVLAVGILRAVAKGYKADKGLVRQLAVNNLEPLPAVVEDEDADGPAGAPASPEDTARLKKMATPEILGLLAETLAPHIAGHDQIKEAIILAMVSAPAYHRNGFRRIIHVLIVGDPSTAKTQLLMAGHVLDPASQYASGKGSSGVGLTAAVTKDASGVYSLSPGTIVYADGSVAFIDEFDKIGFGDRGALLGATEIQLLDINKGGIKATMPARTSIVAAANPKDGVYNPGRTVAENINLEPALLSRFDLVYVVRDVPDRARDGEVADAITGQAAGTIKSPLDVKTAAEYISLARQIRPTIQPDVRGLVRRYYQDARQASSESSVRLTSRQVSAVVRVATAKAKIELRNTVTPDDIRYAIGIVDRMLDGAARDPATGKIDPNILQGARELDSTRIELVRSMVRTLCEATGCAARLMVVREMRAACAWQDDSEPAEFLQRCISEGHVIETPDGLRLPPSP